MVFMTLAIFYFGKVINRGMLQQRAIRVLCCMDAGTATSPASLESEFQLCHPKKKICPREFQNKMATFKTGQYNSIFVS